MVVLELKNICKKYNNKAILENINLVINEGEIFGLIGLNGIGKTTLIKIILNLINKNSGEGYICNKNIEDCRSRENIFYLPEKFQPSQNLKVLEFIKLFTNSKTFDINKIEQLVEFFDLNKEILSKKISSLSKGMTQKIGLITSVLEDKKLIILDEPMTGLDPKARIYLKDLLLKYKNEGKTVFFSSHILSDIDEVCDRIAVLNKCNIRFVGSPVEFKNKHGEQSLEKAFLKEII